MQMTEDMEKKLQDLPLVIGVDLGGTQLRVAVMQGSKLHSRVGLLVGKDTTPDTVINQIAQGIHQALEEADVTLEQIVGIGVGAPGPLDNRTGVVFSPPNLHGWHEVPLRDILQQRFNVPIFVENDANTAGLGEYIFGAGRGSEDMVYLTISTGIGGGVIVKGEILEGVSGTAAELGHMTIDMHGPQCNCGNIGCLEAIASGTAIARLANNAIAAGDGEELLQFVRGMREDVGKNLDSYVHPTIGITSAVHDKFVEAAGPLLVNARTVSEAAKAGIPLAREIINNAGEALGVGLVNIIHIFNPAKIILGGGVTQMGDLILDPARRIVAERAMRHPLKAVTIEVSDLGGDVGLIGAGALVYHFIENRL
ncbi:MAG TPA: ROK family protein [Ktedonobacteraceae bacterium]|nr:ROK family protein [Ktedonobacteraceae bacterium]